MEIKWKDVAPLPTCRSGHSAVLFHDMIYVGGGSEERGAKKLHSYNVHVYNLRTSEWNKSIATKCCDFAMTTLNDKLVIVGGAMENDVVLNNISVLNTATGEWVPYNNYKLPIAKYNTTAIGYRSLLIVVGGVMPTKGLMKKVSGSFWAVQSTTELLDTKSGQWHTCENLPSPHSRLRAVIVDNTLYLLGGADLSYKPSPKVFGASLDGIDTTHQLNWQHLGDVLYCYSTPVVMCNKYLLTIGGKSDDNSLTSEVRALNPSNSLWKQVATIPSPAYSLAAVSTDNKLVVIGGTSQDKKFSNTIWSGVFE